MMNRPITLCDRCKEYARCCLNYDGDNCRRIRTVEPTNADRIRAMSDEDLAGKFEEVQLNTVKVYGNDDMLLAGELRKYWLDWLKQEAE